MKDAMRTTERTIAFALLFLILSCSTGDTTRLRVVSSFPAGIVPRDTVFVVAFSRGVVPPESLNVWTLTPYMKFSPEVSGKFTWTDTSKLIFSPDGPLPGDTRISATLNTALLARMSGSQGFSGPDAFQCATPPFTLRGAEFFYDRLDANRQVGIKANLEFSYSVDPQELARRLSVTVDGTQQSGVKIMATERARIIPIELGSAQQSEKEHRIAVGVEADLTSPETNTRITQQHPFEFTLPPVGDLAIYGHEAGFDGASGYIRVRMSQEVDPATVKNFVRLEPNKEFSVTGGGTSFLLRGKFDAGTTLTLTIAAGLESILGGRTRSAYEADVYIGSIPPTFRFSSVSGVYMLLGGERKLEIKTINVPKLTVRVSQLFQNNLVYFIQNGRFYDYDYSENDEGGEVPSYRRKFRYYLGNYGRQLSFDTLAVKGPENQETTTLLDLSPFMHTGYKGFYLIEIANAAEQWRTTSKLVSISDIGIIVKRSPDGATVFTTSLETTAPLPGAVVNLMSTNNQVVASAKTDGDGVARFSGLGDKAKDFPLELVTAELNDDFNFLTFDDYRVETSRYDVGGKHENHVAYDAFLYADRNLYRPGETIVLSGIVRNLTEAIPASMPVKLKIVSPRGSTVAEQQIVLNSDGAFETTFPTRPSSLTGEYQCELSTGSGLYLASYRAHLEDFMPDRLRVTLNPSKERSLPGETLRYGLTAYNFFGPPAAGRTWQFEASFDPQPFFSKTFPEYRFANDAVKGPSVGPVVLEGKTDQHGAASFDVAMPSTLAANGIVRVRARVAVFDESGRPVYQVAPTLLDPKPYYIGLLNRGPLYVNPGVTQTLNIAAVTPADNPIKNFRARVHLVRYEWHSVLRQHGSDRTLRYVSERREIPERVEVLSLADGKGEFSYTPTRSGEYAIRVSKDGDDGYNQWSFYSYSWGSTDITSFEIDPEARVDITLDKAIYAPGEHARVLFRAPFDGKLLATIERNGVLIYRYLTVQNNAASMEFTVEEKHLPTVYVSAVLFRSVKDVSIPLLAGHGFAAVMVEKKSNKLEVMIKAPERAHPRSRQMVTVTVAGGHNVAVTLAAVDEGILQLKNYKTPDPYGYFYARRALETDTYDFFKHLIAEPSQRKSSTGGSDMELGRRVNPLSVQRVKPVAFWSGIRRTNGNGEAQIPIDLPDFNGEVRLMALAYKDDRFGSAQQSMTVSDPVIVTPALPRFLAPGDSVSMAITAFNTTPAAVSLNFDVQCSGGVALTTPPVQLAVGGNQERYATAGLRVARQLGKASVTVKTTGAGLTVESSTELSVRPVTPLQTETQSGIIQAGATVTRSVSDAYFPEGRRAYVTLSPFPVVNFSGRLKNLLGYPYGCAEQITSKAFPQLYLRDIAAVMAPGALATGSPTYFVNEAIALLSTLQTPDGTFLMWPGGTTSNPWSTVYATHFLLEARKAGYTVGDALVKPALSAVAAIGRGKKTMDYGVWRDGKVTVRRIADKSVIYALYVLSLAGAPDKNVMDFYRGDRSLLSTDSRVMLAAGYALSGDRRAFTELIPADFVVEDAARTAGADLDSPIRSNALILNMLLDTDLNNVNIPRYMDYLSRRYAKDDWFSTQDDAFTLLAFGKAARMAAGAKLSGTVKLGGKEVAYTGGTQKFDGDPFGKEMTIALSGEGRAYYAIVVEGMRSDGAVKEEDRNLQVRREFLDRSGNPVNVSVVRQNDLVVVRVRLTSNVDVLENVAIADLLPAGFEIENPRLTQMGSYPFTKDASTAEYLDVRDDRMLMYTGFHGGGHRQQIFYYAMRAVTPGRYTYPAIVAEAMYDGEYHSVNGSMTIRITR